MYKNPKEFLKIEFFESSLRLSLNETYNKINKITLS